MRGSGLVLRVGLGGSEYGYSSPVKGGGLGVEGVEVERSKIGEDILRSRDSRVAFWVSDSAYLTISQGLCGANREPSNFSNAAVAL